MYTEAIKKGDMLYAKGSLHMYMLDLSDFASWTYTCYEGTTVSPPAQTYA